LAPSGRPTESNPMTDGRGAPRPAGEGSNTGQRAQGNPEG
jgi:hypothetical protein